MEIKYSPWDKFKYWCFKNTYHIIKVPKLYIVYRFYNSNTGYGDYIGTIKEEIKIKPNYMLSCVDVKNQIGIPSSLYKDYIKPKEGEFTKRCSKLLYESQVDNRTIVFGEDYAWLKGENIQKVDWYYECDYEDATTIDNWKERILEK